MYVIIILSILILGLLYLINRKGSETESFSNFDKFISISNYKLAGNNKINMYNVKIHNEILDEIEGGSVCS